MIFPIALAIVLLAFHPGGPRALLRLRFRGVALIWAAAAVQLVRITDPSWAAPFLGFRGGVLPVVSTWALGAVFVAVNLSPHRWRVRVGFGVLALGFTLNTLVIVVNGGMPFSARAARWAGFPERMIAETGIRYQQTSAGTRLAPLGDVLPVPLLQKVVSVGDVLMFVGIFWLLVALTRTGDGSGDSFGAGSQPAHPTLAKGGVRC
jgi:hypothetical protein